MKCSEIQDLLTGHLLGDLDPAVSKDIEAHLGECSDCQAFKHELESTLDLVQDALVATRGAPTRLQADRLEKVMKAKYRPVIEFITTQHPRFAQAAAVLIIGLFLLCLITPAMQKARELAYTHALVDTLGERNPGQMGGQNSLEGMALPEAKHSNKSGGDNWYRDTSVSDIRAEIARDGKRRQQEQARIRADVGRKEVELNMLLRQELAGGELRPELQKKRERVEEELTALGNVMTEYGDEPTAEAEEPDNLVNGTPSTGKDLPAGQGYYYRAYATSSPGNDWYKDAATYSVKTEGGAGPKPMDTDDDGLGLEWENLSGSTDTEPPHAPDPGARLAEVVKSPMILKGLMGGKSAGRSSAARSVPANDIDELRKQLAMGDTTDLPNDSAPQPDGEDSTYETTKAFGYTEVPYPTEDLSSRRARTGGIDKKDLKNYYNIDPGSGELDESGRTMAAGSIRPLPPPTEPAPQPDPEPTAQTGAGTGGRQVADTTGLVDANFAGGFDDFGGGLAGRSGSGSTRHEFKSMGNEADEGVVIVDEPEEIALHAGATHRIRLSRKPSAGKPEKLFTSDSPSDRSDVSDMSDNLTVRGPAPMPPPAPATPKVRPDDVDWNVINWQDPDGVPGGGGGGDAGDLWFKKVNEPTPAPVDTESVEKYDARKKKSAKGGIPILGRLFSGGKATAASGTAPLDEPAFAEETVTGDGHDYYGTYLRSEDERDSGEKGKKDVAVARDRELAKASVIKGRVTREERERRNSGFPAGMELEKKAVEKALKDEITRDKLQSTVIPEINLQNADIKDAIAFLEKETGKKVDIRTDLGDTAPPKVSFTARHVSAQQALDIVTEVANLKYRIDEDKVVVTPKDYPSGKLVTTFYDIDEDLLNDLGVSDLDGRERDEKLKISLTEMGVEPPQGSSMSYNPELGKLIVSNTEQNHAVLAGILKKVQMKREAEKEEAARKELVRFKAHGLNPFVLTAENAFSTFAIDVDTAAYTLARNYMSRGLLPPAESVRTEEFVNFFDYEYRAPEQHVFDVYTECAPTPFGRGLHTLKIGVKGKRIGRDQQRNAVLTFVIDTSGSMNTPDRLGLLRKSLSMLVDKLGPNDRIAIVQYDSRARMILDYTTAAEKAKIMAALDRMQTSGSTNLEEGLREGYRVAAAGFAPGAMNRVLLLSDGVANMGTDNADAMLDNVEEYREQGIYCSVYGFGIGKYNDEMLESLADKGDGTYSFIDSEKEAKRVFVDELGATLNVIAKDAKIQVEFNPKLVKQYRQLGYENRQLTKQQFRDNTVDAGEVGSGQAVTALYEMDLDEDGLRKARRNNEPIATVRVRYEDPDTGEVDEMERRFYPSEMIRRFEQAPDRFKLATCVAEFAEILRGSDFARGSTYEDIATELRPVAQNLHLDKRVAELLTMVSGAGSMSRGN